jgi:hypothetical protein
VEKFLNLRRSLTIQTRITSDINDPQRRGPWSVIDKHSELCTSDDTTYEIP